MNSNALASASAPTDERLHTLNEIAQDWFGVDTLPSCTDEPEARYVVCARNIAQALESAYDIGLITGYRLSRATRS